MQMEYMNTSSLKCCIDCVFPHQIVVHENMKVFNLFSQIVCCDT